MTRDYYKGKHKYVKVGSDCVLYHAYWDGTAKDHSLYANDGTVVGAGFVEGGLQFDGTDDGVNIVDNSEMDIGTGSWTWLFWIKPTTTTAIQRIVGSNYGAGIWFYSVNLAADGTYIRGTVYNDAWGPHYQAVDLNVFNFFDGDSHMIGYVCDRVTPKVWFIVDNVWYETISMEGTTAGSIATTTVGFSGIASDHTNGPYKGIIHESIWFNSLKDSDDVTDYYDFTSSRYA